MTDAFFTEGELQQRLPRWAAARIRTLQEALERRDRDIEYMSRKLQEGPGDSDVFADAYSEAQRPLGKGAHVRFGGAGYDGTWDVHLEDGELHVKLNALSSRSSVAVIPWSANDVRIRSIEP